MNQGGFEVIRGYRKKYKGIRDPGRPWTAAGSILGLYWDNGKKIESII